MINTNYWPQKFGLVDAHTPEAREAFVQKYAAELEALTTRVAGRLRDDRAEGAAVDRRSRTSQHDMLGASRESANERTRELNAAIEEVGKRTGTPVFPWARLFNEHLEETRLRRVVSPVVGTPVCTGDEFQVQQLGGDHVIECFARGRGRSRESVHAGSETRAWIARELDEMPRARAPRRAGYPLSGVGTQLARVGASNDSTRGEK